MLYNENNHEVRTVLIVKSSNPDVLLNGAAEVRQRIGIGASKPRQPPESAPFDIELKVAPGKTVQCSPIQLEITVDYGLGNPHPGNNRIGPKFLNVDVR